MTVLVIFSLLVLMIAVLYALSAKGLISLTRFKQRQEEEFQKIEPVLNIPPKPATKSKPKTRKPRRKPKVE